MYVYIVENRAGKEIGEQNYVEAVFRDKVNAKECAHDLNHSHKDFVVVPYEVKTTY